MSPANTAPKKHRSPGEPLGTLFDLTRPGIEPKTCRTGSDVLNHYWPTGCPSLYFLFFSDRSWYGIFDEQQFHPPRLSHEECPGVRKHGDENLQSGSGEGFLSHQLLQISPRRADASDKASYFIDWF